MGKNNAKKYLRNLEAKGFEKAGKRLMIIRLFVIKFY